MSEAIAIGVIVAGACAVLGGYVVALRRLHETQKRELRELIGRLRNARVVTRVDVVERRVVKLPPEWQAWPWPQCECQKRKEGGS